MSAATCAAWLAGAAGACALADLARAASWRPRSVRWAARLRERAGRRRRAAEFAAAAPATARALADALGAGRSLPGAVAAAGEAVPGVAGRELRAAARAIGAGAPVDAALERLRRRAGGPGWTTLAAAIDLQREAGGDLAVLLRDLAASLEAAERVRAQARTATAQARFTVRIVLGLPLAAGALGELAAPGTLGAMLAHPVAALALLTSGALQLLALGCVRRIVRVPG